MDGKNELTVDPDDDTRINTWEERVYTALRTLSVTSEFTDLRYNEETGPGMFIVQIDGWSVENGEREDQNAWADTPNGEDIYLDDDMETVYSLFDESAIEDEAMIIMANGQPLQYNVFINVPDEVWEGVNTEDESGAKHKTARAVSDMENVYWTGVLSEKDGDVDWYRSGGNEFTDEREDLIEEVNSGDADWFPYKAWRSVEEEWSDGEEVEEPEWLDLEQYKVA